MLCCVSTHTCLSVQEHCGRGCRASYTFPLTYLSLLHIGIPRFITLRFITHRECCIFFFQIEGLWRPCVRQVCWCHFPATFTHFVSLSHFGFPRNISNFIIICYGYLWYVITTRGKLRWWLAFSGN